MPVQGETSELPLPDIMGMVRYRTGKLLFSSIVSTPDVEVHVTPGYITAMIVDDKLIQDDWRIVDKLVAITASPAGDFTFQSCAPSDLKHSVRINIDGILLTVVTAIDEILCANARLPNHSQLYQMVPGRDKLVVDDATLETFLHVARPDLEIGLTAIEFAHRLEISTKQVQFYFLKLIELGMITKMRLEDSPLHSDPRLSLKSTGIRLAESKLETTPNQAPILSRESRKDNLPQRGRMTRLI